MEDVLDRVGVIGCGLMGSGIAEVCARADRDVIVLERDADAVAQGRSTIGRSLDRAVRSGKLDEAERDRVVAHITVTHDLDALHDRELVVEAVPEVLEMKLEAFRTMDRVVTSPTAILATNTSSLPIMRLASVTRRPEQVCGLHFFNPVPILNLVELVTSLMTGTETARRAEKFAAGPLGKHVVRSQDRAGFIVNALLIPYMLSAVRMLESGFASAEDIDSSMVQGCAHPLGPLRLTDLIGVDTTVHVAQSLYEEFKEPLYAPPPVLLRMMDAGLLGRKSGRGFYDYAEA